MSWKCLKISFIFGAKYYDFMYLFIYLLLWLLLRSSLSSDIDINYDPWSFYLWISCLLAGKCFKHKDFSAFQRLYVTNLANTSSIIFFLKSTHFYSFRTWLLFSGDKKKTCCKLILINVVKSTNNKRSLSF